MKTIGIWIIKIVSVIILYTAFAFLIHWQFGDKWLEPFTIMTLACLCGVSVHSLMTLKVE